MDCSKKSSSELKGTGEFLNTDLMFEVDYSDTTGWKSPKISGYHKLEIDPRNSVLHYAMQAFEGISVRRSLSNKNKIVLFRPDCHIQRLQNSADRLGFPVIQ